MHAVTHYCCFFFSSRRRHTRLQGDWSSDVCSSDLAFAFVKVVMKKLMPQSEVVSEGWPKLGTTDFASHITKAIAAKPDLIVSSVWGEIGRASCRERV